MPSGGGSESDHGPGFLPPQEQPPQPAEVEAPARQEPEPVGPPQLTISDIPWDTLFPPTNDYRKAIVEKALPHLVPLLLRRDRRAPRDLTNKALEECDRCGQRFWGRFDVYTRKRSVCDAILSHYFTELEEYLVTRRV